MDCSVRARDVVEPTQHPITFGVNGRLLTVDVRAHQTLLEVLRDHLQLTGTKECCAEGECGACTVLLDGRAVNSCLVLAMEAEGQKIVTIEGLDANGRLAALQDAFLEHGAVQCGFCIPGMLMAATSLLATNPDPTITEIQEGLAGNLCRCAGYSRIIAAVIAAARARS
ncbi:MAG: (2Fe-2S)-binding protein [Acidobacteria bacterium]|nr:MAG: (2Fe-2S)-binding protein [Acidobacteriota bacterium]